MPATERDAADCLRSASKQHTHYVVESLKENDALPFLGALQAEIESEFNLRPETAEALIDWFLAQPVGNDGEGAKRLFYLVRRALLAVDGQLRPAVEKAASALYFFCACGTAVALERDSEDKGVYLRVPRSENIYCAIVATVAFGGKLRFAASIPDGLPRCEYVFEVAAPAGGDQYFLDFERAAYVTLFPNKRKTPEVARGAGPLSEDERQEMEERFGTIRQVQKECLGLVVVGESEHDAHQTFARKYPAPVMFVSKKPDKLLAIPAATLIANIREFMQELRQTDRHSAEAGKPPNDEGMPPSGAAKVDVAPGLDDVAKAAESGAKVVDNLGKIVDKAPTIGSAIALIGRLFS